MIKHAVTMTYPNTIGDICVQFGAVALYSFIRPFRDSTQAFIVRRQSDNATQTINYDGEEVAAAAETFCAGTNGFITTLFDQIGANNATQTTATAQPQIVTNGQYIRSGELLVPPQPTPPNPFFDGVNDCLRVSGFPASTAYQALWIDFDGVYVRKIKTPVSGAMSLPMGKNSFPAVADFIFLAYFPVGTDTAAVQAALFPYFQRFVPYLNNANHFAAVKPIGTNTGADSGIRLTVSSGITITVLSSSGSTNYNLTAGSTNIPLPYSNPNEMFVIRASNLLTITQLSRFEISPVVFSAQLFKGDLNYSAAANITTIIGRIFGGFITLRSTSIQLANSLDFMDVSLFFGAASAPITTITQPLNNRKYFGTLPTLAGYTSLIQLALALSEITDAAAGFAVPTSLTDFNLNNNNLTQAAVNAILIACDAAWPAAPIVRTLNLGGLGNAAPTGAGITAKNNLITKGHTIITN